MVVIRGSRNINSSFIGMQGCKVNLIESGLESCFKLAEEVAEDFKCVRAEAKLINIKVSGDIINGILIFLDDRE
jgi:hypothetical protein